MKTFFLQKLKKATSGTLVFALLFSVLSPWASIVPLAQAVYTPVGSFNTVETVANNTTATVPATTLTGGANIVNATVPATTLTGGSDAVAASKTDAITLSGAVPANGDTVTVGGTVYTFRTALTNAAVEDEVLIGVDIPATVSNLIAGINAVGCVVAGGTPAAEVCAGTVADANVTASAGTTASQVTLTAKATGTGGNALTVAASFVTPANVIVQTPLAGGAAAVKATADMTFTGSLPANATDHTISIDSVSIDLGTAALTAAEVATVVFSSGAAFPTYDVTNPSPGVVHFAAKTAGAAGNAAVAIADADYATRAQVVTFTPVSPTVGETFSGSINGTSYTYTVTGSMTVAQVVTAFAPLIDANAAVNCTDDTTTVTCTATTPGTAFTYAAAVVDITPPSAPVVTLLDPVNSANKTAVTLTGTTENDASFSYTVSDSATGTVAGTGAASSTGLISIAGIDTTALINGTLTASVVATDSAGNASATGSDTATKDTVAPTATLTGSTSATLSGTSVTAVAVALSEAATDFGSGDVTVTNGTLSNFAGSGTGYSFDVTATGATPLTVMVNTGSFSDAVGNTNITASNTLSYTVDFTAPIITSTGSVTTGTGTATFTGITLTESNFSGATLSYSGVGNSSLTGVINLNGTVLELTWSVSGLNANATYAYSITAIDSVWNVTVLPVGTFQTQFDYAALYNQIGTSLSASGIANNFTGVTNDNVTNFPNLYFENPQYGKILFSTGLNLTDSGTITFLQNLPNYLDMTDGHINFSASGSLFQSYGATLFMYFTGASVPEFSGNSLDYITARDEAGNIFTDALSGSTLLCAVWVGIPYQVCTFANNHFTSFDFNPYLTSVHIQSNNASGALAKAGNTVSISFSGSEVLSGVTATIAGQPATVTGANTSWVATYTMTGGEAQWVLPFTIRFSDVNNNSGTTVTGATDGSSVTFDSMIPTATVVYSTTGAINGSVTVTLTGASESITVTNNSGSLTKVFAANGSFIFEFSDVTGNTGSTMATVSNIDTTAPALSSISVTPDVSGTGANYTFDVNETATGTIYVGTGTSVLSTLVVSGSTAKTGSATHTGVLAGLTAGADYYYYIKATDAAGNITNSATGTFSSADTASPNVFNKRVDGITSTNGTVKFDFIDANYTVGTGPKTGTGHVTIGTGTSLNNIGTGYLAVATGSVNTASSAFASLVADTVYNYAISVTDNFGNPSSASTGSFVTASAPIDLTVSSTNTGITTLTGATVASGSGLALSGVITVVSDSNDSNSLTGSLVLSWVTNITVSGSSWNGTLLPPTLVQSGSSENASTGEISTIIPQTSFVTVGNTTTTTTYTSVILQTVKIWGESGVSLIASGSNFRVSFAVPSSSSGTVLKLYRSIDGSVWEANSPDTSCTLDANKLCTFDTNHLSFFAPTLVTSNTSSVTASSWGGGGGVLSIDACPSGDTSGSYYDGKCSNGLTSTGTASAVGSGATVSLTKTKDQVTVTTTTASGTTTTVFSIPPVILKSLTDIQFTDISDNWAKNYIIHLVARGVVDNTENYHPDNNLTRAEFLKITMNAAGWQVPATGTTSFEDVPAQMWYTPYVALALSKGIVTGQNVNFRPNDSISRAEAAKIIVGIFGANVGSTTTSFADVDVASDLAKFIETAKTLGFFSGQNIDGKLVFRPNDSITRAEIAKVIVNAFGL